MDSQSIYSLLQKILAFLAISCSFGAVNLKLSTEPYHCSFKIRQPFAKQMNIEKNWGNKTNQEESEWIINIIKKYTRVTKPFDSVNVAYVFPVNPNYSRFLRYGLLLFQIIATVTVLAITCDPNHCRFKIRQQFAEENLMHSNRDNQTNQVESEWIINVIKKYTRVTKCQVPIYILSKKNQKLLLLITMRSSKPSELSIGGIFTASHEIFAEDPYHCRFKIRQQFAEEKLMHTNRDNQTNQVESEWIINVIQKYTRVTKCQVPIYILSKKNQKLLLLITMRSSKPSELLIGDLFSASHEMFAGLYQCSQLTLDSQSTYSILQKLLAAFGIVCSYNLIRDLVSYIEYDYENFLDENDLKISEKYMKMTRLYIIFYVCSAILYGILTIIPTIFSIFLYKYRSLDSVNIPYMFPVNTNYSGFLRYGLLLCQIIALFTILTMACVIYSIYLDPSFCRFKIRQQFAEEKFIHVNTDNQTNEEESVWIINIIRRYIRVTKCQVPIYTLAKKNQKLLLLITMRSSKPSELSIGGLFSSSYEIFAELYQCSQLTLDSQSTYSILQKLLAAFGIVCSYNLIRDLVSYIEYDYENFIDENDLKISEKYTKLTRLYIIIFIGEYPYVKYEETKLSSKQGLLYRQRNSFRSFDSVNIPYMFPVNTNYSGFLRYGWLLCQIIALFTILTMACVIYSIYLILDIQVIMQKSANKILECFFTISFSIFAIYINFHFGQMLINHSTGVFEELCQVPIYTLAKKNQNLLLLITMRSSKPSELSIGGLFSSSNEVFAGIMQLSTILQNTRDTVECFICIVGSIVTIFIIFYMGQTLINHSIAVFDELRQTPFYVLSIKTQKLLQFLIARSIKPCELSIGGLFVASHETFSVILQKALSFATILQLSDILQNTSKTFECSVVIVGSIMTVYINFYIGQVVIDYSRAALEEL
ncbi:hypothetical protein M0804_007460 [Polistes exclamans]|nr:hypothetical protein M0804_007460 [Polistes exclamans]